MSEPLDIQFVREQFPAFNGMSQVSGQFFDSAAGSFPCQQTVDSLHEFYTYHKVQPGNAFSISQQAMEKMRFSKRRWAEALGVEPHEVGFGPSTSQNIYVLANAFRELLKPGDEVIVTNQDHEANTGVMRRAVVAAGAVLREWKVDPGDGLLSIEGLQELLNDSTRLVCFTHSSNITGQKNDAGEIVKLAHQHDAYALVDGVSYAPHEIPDVAAIGADIYVFSLYKVFSVHQGILVVREALLEKLPKQGHYFKHKIDVDELLVPAGPDHAQTAAAAGVLEYIEKLAVFHGGGVDGLRSSCDLVSGLWHQHEAGLLAPLLEFFKSAQSVRVLGTMVADRLRCPLVSFVPSGSTTAALSRRLCDEGILLSHGDFYAPRLLEATGIDPAEGVIRISMAHYNSLDEVNTLIARLEPLL